MDECFLSNYGSETTNPAPSSMQTYEHPRKAGAQPDATQPYRRDCCTATGKFRRSLRQSPQQEPPMYLGGQIGLQELKLTNAQVLSRIPLPSQHCGFAGLLEGVKMMFGVDHLLNEHHGGAK